MKNSVLLVEDDIEIRNNISDLLSRQGYDVVKADCGTKAIELAENQLPGLVVCESKMRDMDGYQVYTALFSKLFRNRIHFIYFTKIPASLDKENIRILSLENFMDKHLYDPDLLAYVENCLPRKREQFSLQNSSTGQY